MKSADVRNRLLAALRPRDFELISAKLEAVSLGKRTVLFEPQEDVKRVHFPTGGMIVGLVLNLHDGGTAESAMIGQEGAAGGVVSSGGKPAFTRGVVQLGGTALRLSTDALEVAKQQSPTLRDHFARYADCLLAQALQSVACNALHDFDARLARWLLDLHDRIGTDDLYVTQDFIGQMLGVHRSYSTRVINDLERTGAIRKARGTITVVNRRKLEYQACECYDHMRQHFARLLPRVYMRSP